jgi:hypothetical protein
LVFNFILDAEGDEFEQYPPHLWAEAEPVVDNDDMMDVDAEAEGLRDEIANRMWLDYQRHLDRQD